MGLPTGNEYDYISKKNNEVYNIYAQQYSHVHNTTVSARARDKQNTAVFHFFESF
jgi:hypothetical protein